MNQNPHYSFQNMTTAPRLGYCRIRTITPSYWKHTNQSACPMRCNVQAHIREFSSSSKQPFHTIAIDIIIKTIILRILTIISNQVL